MKISTMIKKLKRYKKSNGDIEIYTDEEAKYKVKNVNAHCIYGKGDVFKSSYLVIYSSSK